MNNAASSTDSTGSAPGRAQAVFAAPGTAASASGYLSSVQTSSVHSSSRYSRVAIVLHWLIAALVLSTIPIGWFSASGTPPPRLPASVTPGAAATAGINAPKSAAPPFTPPPPKTAAQQTATNAHKTIGIVILSLTLLRIGWRLTHKPPALPQGMARPLRWAAKTSHALFYLLLLVMPLSGWWMSSAIPDSKRHAFGFGIFDIPFLPVPRGWASAGAAKFVHTSLVWLMVGLVVLHICAALKHHFIDKDDVLARMLPQNS